MMLRRISVRNFEKQKIISGNLRNKWLLHEISFQNQAKRLSHSMIDYLKEFRNQHTQFIDLVKDHGEGSFKLKKHHRFLELEISNLGKKNAISGKMMNQLSEIVLNIYTEIYDNKDLVALVIRGEGDDVFASGADLSLASEVLDTPAKGVLMANYMTPLLNMLRGSPLIVVNYINGFAVGGGAELSTVGDFRIMVDQTASKKANFVQFVHARIGASPGWGGGQRLTSIVGRKAALQLLASSKRVSPDEALRIGLVDLIHSRNQSESLSSDQIIEQFLQPYLEQPYSRAVRSMKRIVRANDPSFELPGLSFELKEFGHRWRSEENIHALTPKSR